MKIIHEAFYRLLITAATEWYAEKGETLIQDATLELLDELATAYRNRDEKDTTIIAKEILPQVQEIEEKIQAFRNLDDKIQTRLYIEIVFLRPLSCYSI